MSKKELTESQFYMWRTLFALAHVDGVVRGEEVRFMAETLEDVPFSDIQRAILNDDIKHAQNVEAMFRGITDVRDQAAFFKYARTLVHIDGDYDRAEQAIMLRLQEIHLQHADMDSLIGAIQMELEDEGEYRECKAESRKKGLKEIIFSFREQFMKDRFK